MGGDDQPLIDPHPTGVISYDPTSSCPKCGKKLDVLSTRWDTSKGKLVFVYECKPCETRYQNG